MGQGVTIQEAIDSGAENEKRYLVKPRMVTWAKNVFGNEADLAEGLEGVQLR